MKIPENLLNELISSINLNNFLIHHILDEETTGISFEFYNDDMWFNILEHQSYIDHDGIFGSKWDNCLAERLECGSVDFDKRMMEDVIPLSHPKIQELILELQMRQL